MCCASVRDLLDLTELEFDRRRTTENGNGDLHARTLLVDFLDNAGERGKRAVGHLDVLTDLEGSALAEGTRIEGLCAAAGMKQVLTNLLANASRFSKPDGQVEVALGKTATNLVVEVRDHGEGIPEQLREKVFERFYRADNSRNRETGGNGIGLAIVKTIVERHGGNIVAVETPGGGATFRVTLPLQ